MTTIRVTCQHCSFSRDVPEEKIPDRPIQVTCPRCSQRFVFHKPAASGSAPLTSPPDTASAGPSAAPSLPQSSVPRSARQPVSIPVAPPEVLPAGKPASLALVLLLLLAVVGAAWWLNVPSLSTVPDGAHRDAKNGFAVKAPGDWLLVTPENYRAMVEQLRDRIPAEFSRMIGTGKAGFAVSFLKIPAAEGEFAPNCNLSVIDTKGKNLPALTESEKQKAAEAVSGELSRVLPTYRLLESRIVPVDGVDALQLVGEAEMTVVTKKSTPIYSEPGAFGLRRITGYTEAESQTLRLRAIQTMVPGRKRAYALNFMYDELKSPEMGKVHDDLLESFRLLERPPRFGGIVMGALNGGLFGAGLYLFGLVIGRFFRTQE